jgi:hypothetical protein
MPYSTCCGAETKNTEQDICPICRYFCDWEEIPSEEPSDEETFNNHKTEGGISFGGSSWQGR